jgi:flagellar protein FlgJ
MMTQSTTATDLSIDPKGMDGLRQSAKANSPEALRDVARQFEGLFMNMVMKSMRDASPKDGVFDSEQGKMFTSMLDQQLSQNLAKRGVGLADVLIRQLSNNRSINPNDAISGTGSTKPNNATNGLINDSALDAVLPGKPRAGGLAQAYGAEQGFDLSQNMELATNDLSAVDTETKLGNWPHANLQATVQQALDSGIPGVLKAVLGGVKKSVTALADVGHINHKARPAQSANVRAFENKLAVHAQEAADATGIPAKFMLGQAALESGWGKREILAADGSPSHNVFGIKAGAGWKGKVIETATTEYVHGVPTRKVERFRAYDNYSDAFKDYAKLLQNNPRYQSVIANAQDIKGFAQGLQRAGYATDPQYADKITRIVTQSLSA